MNLGNKHFKTEYNINGYSLYNTDRTSGNRGGGVAVYIRNSLNSCIKTGIKATEEAETIWVEIKDIQHSIILGVVNSAPILIRESSNIIWD